MGRDDPTFSILYEFRTSLSKIKEQTNLPIKNGSTEVRLQSPVSPESFALLCRHLNGESITITESTATDLYMLGSELKCPSLLNLVRCFGLSSKRHDLGTTIKEIDEQIYGHRAWLESLQWGCDVIRKEFSKVEKLISNFSLKNQRVNTSESLSIDGIDFSGKINHRDLGFVKERLSHLSSLMATVESERSIAKSCANFQSEMRHSFVSSMRDDANEFLVEKADFADSWCQLCIGKLLLGSNYDLGMKYLSLASQEGTWIRPMDLARMLISGRDSKPSFNAAIVALERVDDKEVRKMREELGAFVSALNSHEVVLDVRRYPNVISCLETLVIPSVVAVITGKCFKYWSCLREVRIEEGSQIFKHPCVWLQESSVELVYIPDSVESLCNDCFIGCASLSRVIFGRNSGLKSIGERAFAGCENLQELEIPRGVAALSNAWWHNSSLARICFASDSIIRAIGNNAFSGCANLKEIELPESVEVIGNFCFSGCLSLSRVKLGDGLKMVGNSVFQGCEKLQEIVIPSSVTSLSRSWWRESFISRVGFGSSSVFMSIGDNAFSEFKTLKELEIPADLETLSGVWWKGSFVTSLVFAPGSRMRSVAKGALNHVKSLKSIEIPASVEELTNMWWAGSSISNISFAPGSVIKFIGRKSFTGPCGNLRSIDIPVSVEEIGDDCFNNVHLASVTFANGSRLKRIGNGAFAGCDDLVTIHIPAAVEELGDCCFARAKSLHDVNFASESCLKSIGKAAFCGCSRLYEIVIPAGVERIGDCVFNGCNLFQASFSGKNELFTIIESFIIRNDTMSLFTMFRNKTEIEIPANVEEISDLCFGPAIDYRGGIDRSNNIQRGLSRVVFQNGSVLKRIGKEAFRECSALKEIDIPESVEEIGERCFYQSAISSVTFASGSVLMRIGKEAFRGCKKLNRMEFPQHVEEIGESGFYGCASLSSVLFVSGGVIRRVGQEVFMGCGHLKKIEIPATVEVIAEKCFEGCSSLSCVSFASDSSLKRVESEAFCRCEKLREIQIPASVEEIGCAVFCGCDISSLTFSGENHCFSVLGSLLIRNSDMCLISTLRDVDEIDIPASIEKICEKCFCESSLSSVTFAQGSVLKQIASDAFNRCSGLNAIEIPASVEEIGERCFHQSALSRVTFARGSALRSLGPDAFSICEELKKIEIPVGVEEIGENCFANSSLSSITFAQGSVLKYIRNSAFNWCEKLKRVDLPASLIDIGESSFSGCSAMYCVTFARGIALTNIGNNAFSDCVRLREIEIPASVEEIGENCFSGCSALSRITFASGSVLKRVGNDAFSGCVKLKKVNLPPSVKQSDKTPVTPVVNRPGVLTSSSPLYRAQIGTMKHLMKQTSRMNPCEDDLVSKLTKSLACIVSGEPQETEEEENEWEEEEEEEEEI